MEKLVVHHLAQEFPLDRHFYGQGMVVSSLLAETKLNSAVISSVEDSKDKDLQQRLVWTHYGKPLYFMEFVGNLSSMDSALRKGSNIADIETKIARLEGAIKGSKSRQKRMNDLIAKKGRG